MGVAGARAVTPPTYTNGAVHRVGAVTAVCASKVVYSGERSDHFWRPAGPSNNAAG